MREIVVYEFEDDKLYKTSSVINTILDVYPDAKFVTQWSDYDDVRACAVIYVEETDLDIRVSNAFKLYSNYCKIPARYELILSQSTPISEEILDSIKNDGTNDKYVLRFGNSSIYRERNDDEMKRLNEELKAEQESLRQAYCELLTLQEKQDAQYKLDI